MNKLKKNKHLVNTFASQCFIFEKKKLTISHENASNLTYEFCMTILTRKFIKIFLLKLSYKNSCVNFDAFSRQNGSFIFHQNSESVNSKI